MATRVQRRMFADQAARVIFFPPSPRGVDFDGRWGYASNEEREQSTRSRRLPVSAGAADASFFVQLLMLRFSVAVLVVKPVKASIILSGNTTDRAEPHPPRSAHLPSWYLCECCLAAVVNPLQVGGAGEGGGYAGGGGHTAGHS